MYSRVTIVEAMQLLGSFDSSLRDYAIKKLKSADVRIIEKVQCRYKHSIADFLARNHTAFLPWSNFADSVEMLARLSMEKLQQTT